MAKQSITDFAAEVPTQFLQSEHEKKVKKQKQKKQKTKKLTNKKGKPAI